MTAKENEQTRDASDDELEEFLGIVGARGCNRNPFLEAQNKVEDFIRAPSPSPFWLKLKLGHVEFSAERMVRRWTQPSSSIQHGRIAALGFDPALQ